MLAERRQPGGRASRLALLCLFSISTWQRLSAQRNRIAAPPDLCDMSTDAASRVALVTVTGDSQRIQRPFPQTQEENSLLANESWFTVFVHGKQNCHRFCAEVTFSHDAQLRFYCSGVCDGSGEQPCTCDEQPEFRLKSCIRNMGTKMCNCTRSIAKDTAARLNTQTLLAEPAFEVRLLVFLCK